MYVRSFIAALACLLVSPADSMAGVSIDTIPESLAPYKTVSYPSSLEDEPTPETQYESVFQNPAQVKLSKNPEELEKLAKDTVGTVNSVIELSQSTIRENTIFRIVPDEDFLLQQFRNKWIASLPPEEQKNSELLKQIDAVQRKLKPILINSKFKFQAEKKLKGIKKEWAAAEKQIDKGLHDALELYIREEKNKAVRSGLQDHFIQWNPAEIQSLSDNMAKKLRHGLVFSKSWVLGVKTRFQIWSKLKKYLVEKLTTVPQSSDEEFQFISQKLIKDSDRRSDTKTDLELLQETTASIAARFKFEQEKILALKLQFHLTKMSKIFEGVMRDEVRTELTPLLNRLTKDKKVMEGAYRTKVEDLIYSGNKNFQVQLFKEYFGIEKSAQDIYNTLKELAGEWQVDFDDFERKFKRRLPHDEYSSLVKAASISKEEYTHVLEYIKKQRRINLYGELDTEHLSQIGKYPSFKSSVENFLDQLNQKKVLDGKRLLDSRAECARLGNDPLAFLPFLDSLDTEFKAPTQVYEELKAELIQEKDEYSIYESIKEFLRYLTYNGILTSEERKYLFPYKSPTIEDFRDKLNELGDLPNFFEKKLLVHVHNQFDNILKEKTKDRSFMSLILSNYSEKIISKFKEGMDFDLRQGQYREFMEKLRPGSIKNEVRSHTSNEDWASQFWQEYFKHELPAKISIINKINTEKEKRPPQGPKLKNPKALRGKVLEYLLESKQISESEYFGIPRLLDDVLTSPQIEVEVNKIIQKEHFILMVKPLKENDDRLKNTPLRYLKKEVIYEWNNSVHQIYKNWNEIHHLIFERNKRAGKIRKSLQEIDDYHPVIKEIFDDINTHFLPLGSGFYRFNILPDEPPHSLE